MLNDIIKDLKDSEEKANKIIGDATEEAQEMIKIEKEKQLNLKNKMIEQCNQEGLAIVEETKAAAQQKAKDIFENSKKEKEQLRIDFKKKRDKAIDMILNKLVK